MSEFSPKKALQTIQIIHYVIMATPVLFGLIVLYMSMTGSLAPVEDLELLIYIPPIILVFAMGTSKVIFENQLRVSIKDDSTLKKKMSIYQTAHIIRIALFEMTGLFAAVVCFLTGNLYNLGTILAVTIILYFMTPSVFQLESKVGLTADEKSKF